MFATRANLDSDHDSFPAGIRCGRFGERLHVALPSGRPTAFLGGNLFAGLHQESLMVRLSEPDRVVAITEHGTQPFEPMPGRPMREYVVLSPKILASRMEIRSWLQRALDYATSLPRKAKTPPRKVAAKKPSRPAR